MTDTISKDRRSKNMSKIRGHNTKIEVNFRKALYKMGMHYRLNYKIIGKPDLVIESKKIAIFINGCFWHQHRGCKLATMPKSNLIFWQEKLSKNILRDQTVKEKLTEKGWNVITIWECEIEKNLDLITNKTYNLIIKITKF